MLQLSILKFFYSFIFGPETSLSAMIIINVILEFFVTIEIIPIRNRDLPIYLIFSDNGRYEDMLLCTHAQEWNSAGFGK